MKPPKLIGNLTPDAAVGFSKAKALQDTGAPFLTSSAPGVTTRTKNGFIEVRTEPKVAEAISPYLWCAGFTSAHVFVNALPKHKGKTLLYSPVTHPDGSFVFGSFALWVGANRILSLRATPHSPSSQYFWPVLMLPKIAAEVRPGDPDQGKRAVSLIDSAVADLVTSMFATGFDGATKYRWGIGHLEGSYEGDPGTPSSIGSSVHNVPRVTLGGVDAPTAGGTGGTLGGLGALEGFGTTTVDLPHETSGLHFGGQVFCVGPGKLACLITVAERVNTDSLSIELGNLLPQVVPYLCLSDDHGQTWSRTPATFLSGYIRNGFWNGGMNVPGWRLYYLNGDLADVAEKCSFTYIGGGQSMVLVSDLKATSSTPASAPPGEASVNNQNTHCWRYEGGSFTKLSWPGDTTNGTSGYDTPAGAQSDHLFRSMSACFGPGCFMATIRDTTSFFCRIAYTHDAGASWGVSAPVPWGGAISPVVIAPYISEARAGRMLFMREITSLIGAPEYTEVWSTTGKFEDIKLVGRLTKDSLRAFYAIPFLKRAKVNLALPGEFNAP